MNRSQYSIEYPTNIVFPENLYKYYSINENSLDSVIDEYLYFSHPDQLNDLMDSSEFLINLQDCDEYYYNNMMKHYYNFFYPKTKEIISYEEAKSDGFKELRELINYSKFFHRGVLSLSKNKYDKLMMAHYTSESGFVIEFDTIKLKEHLESEYLNENVHLFPLNYVKKVDKINYFNEIDLKKIKSETNPSKKDCTINDIIPILYVSSIKDFVWKYEEEWRFLLRKDKMGIIKNPLNFLSINKSDVRIEARRINYKRDCLKKIILGPVFLNNSFFKTLRINNKQYSLSLNVEYLKEEKLEEKFRKFLSKICSENFINKIYLQDININENGFQRFSTRLDNLSFNDDVFSFINSGEKF